MKLHYIVNYIFFELAKFKEKKTPSVTGSDITVKTFQNMGTGRLEAWNNKHYI